MFPAFPAQLIGCLVFIVSCMALLFCSADFGVRLGSQVPEKKNMKTIGGRHFSRIGTRGCDRTWDNSLN